MIGSIYERHRIKTEDFPLFQPYCHFTDDTVLTVAIAWAILEGVDYGVALKTFGRRYPHAGYGKAFKQWLLSQGASLRPSTGRCPPRS
ncbi:MAG: hypothetical protein H5T70_05465 [Chloroflexi bacterium]|nr:hypothetical protein [Chloroflexota bacterium]